MVRCKVCQCEERVMELCVDDLAEVAGRRDKSGISRGRRWWKFGLEGEVALKVVGKGGSENMYTGWRGNKTTEAVCRGLTDGTQVLISLTQGNGEVGIR